MSEQPKHKKMMVLSGGRSVMPLIDPLGQAFSLAFLSPQVAEQAAHKGLEVANLGQLTNAITQSASVAKALELYPPVGQAMLSGDLGDLMAEASGNEALGRSFAEQLPGWFPNSVYSSLVRNIERIQVWKALADHFDIAACITHEDVAEDTKCMAAYFRAHKVPTLHVPHAVYMDQWRGAVGNDVHDEITCEWIAAAGPFQRDWYIARGAKPRKVVITGLPQWDKWAQLRDRAWARDALKLDQDRQVVAYGPSWAQATSAHGTHKMLDDGFNAFLDAAVDQKWQALITKHPSCNPEARKGYEMAAKARGIDCLIVDGYLDLIMAAVDLYVSVPSNAAIDAALCGVPSVSLYGYEDDPAVITTDIDGLQGAIEQGLSASWRAEWNPDELIAKYAYSADGQATQRVLDLIKRII